MKSNNQKSNLVNYIYNDIKSKIDSKQYLPNTKIPSERQLEKMYNVSRPTVRLALLRLENENLIYKIHGKGSFVSKKSIYQELDSVYTFHNKIKSMGKTPSSKVVFYDIIECDDFLSQIFNVSLSSKLYQIKRLRLIDDEPVILETTYIPESKFKNFNCELLNERAMYDIFKNDYNIIVNEAKETFRAIMIDSKEDKKYLNLDKNTVGMQIIRTAYSDCKVVEYTKSHLLAGVFEFTVKLSEVGK